MTEAEKIANNLEYIDNILRYVSQQYPKFFVRALPNYYHESIRESFDTLLDTIGIEREDYKNFDQVCHHIVDNKVLHEIWIL